MSRTRMTTRATTQTVEHDRVQELIDALNTISGIEFTEDAWYEKAPNNYGVVEVTGEGGGDHADGRRIAQRVSVKITIYVTGGSHQWIHDVQSVLDQMKLPYTMPQREYLQDIRKVMWTWNTRIRTPLIYTAEEVNNG